MKEESNLQLPARSQIIEQTLDNSTPFSGEYDGATFECDGRIDSANFNDLLIWAQEKKVSDLTIQTGSDVAIQVSGKIHRITGCRTSASDVESIVRYVYGENGPAEVQSGVDLDLSHEIKCKRGISKRFRINITGGRTAYGPGQQISIRPLPGKPLDISLLDIEPEIIENFRPRQGMVLITGPTGSGKSTLLSSGIRMIVEQENAHEKVLEYSSPIEYVFDEIDMPSSLIFQTHAGNHLRQRGESTGGSVFSYCVRNALRRSPTIIVIGEARDKSTIESSVEAALTGHLLYTTMHSTGVASTIRRAVTPFRDSVRKAVASDIMESLRMIVTQILIPKTEGGLIACREFMVFDENTREQFQQEVENRWSAFARKLLQEKRIIGRTMVESATELANKNKISEQTLERIVNKGWD